VDVTGPFFEFGAFGEGTSLLVAVAIGIGFGWFLEQGGMGNARKLAAQFYLTDLTVFKMLFTAVVTAMLGLFWLGQLGIVELSLVYVPPTWIVPQLVGGLVFGLGFVMGGLCPGTSCVAISSGRKDGLALLAGMLGGIFVFGEILPLVEPLYTSTASGTLTLPMLFGLPDRAMVAIVAVAAVGMFWIGERIERRTASRGVPG
jgi:uncharacterized membrane protein YedE/YeeE